MKFIATPPEIEGGQQALFQLRFGFGVQGLGFGVLVSESRLGFRFLGPGFRVHATDCMEFRAVEKGSQI